MFGFIKVIFQIIRFIVILIYYIIRFFLKYLYHPYSAIIGIIFDLSVLIFIYNRLTSFNTVMYGEPVLRDKGTTTLINIINRDDVLGTIIILFIIFASVAGYQTCRVLKRFNPVLQILVYTLGAALSLFIIRPIFDSEDFGDFRIFTFVLNVYAIIFFGTAAAVHVFRYLFSKNPDRLFPGRRNLRAGIKKVTNAWTKKQEIIPYIIIGIFVIQLPLTAALWIRVSNIEKSLGGWKYLACDQKKFIDNAKLSVVRVVGALGEGTGMVVRSDGLILTNHHVIDGEPSPKVILSDYSFLPSEIVYSDKDADTALLKVNAVLPQLPMTVALTLNEFDPLIAIGYPYGTMVRGIASSMRGNFISHRVYEKSPVRYIQFDGTLIEGQSGGPVLKPCSGVVGMITFGSPGLSMAIMSEDIIAKVGGILSNTGELPKVEVVKIEPDKGPKETVEAFYAYIRMGNFEKAYNLVSRERVKDIPLSEWVKGYSRTLHVTLVSAKLDEETNEVFVKVRSMDLLGEIIGERYFEGTWNVIVEKDQWRLGDSNIKEIKDPAWDWFWEK